MACIVYHTDSGGRVYAYSSESYWDKEKHQPRSKRTYLGRVNPETGEIIKGRAGGKNYKPPKSKPDGARNSGSEPNPEMQRLLQMVQSRDETISRLTQENKALQHKMDKINRSVRQIGNLIATIDSD